MSDEVKPAGRETYDDRPFVLNPRNLPPEVQAPLGAFKGATPPSPQWFKDAIAQQPERTFVESLGARLEVLTWGEIGKPGLLFAHGNSAHADWWSFIAPFFAGDFRVAAFSLAGMGGSDWRERYAVADFAQDAETVARAAGLHADGGKPIYVGHSFGGGLVISTAASHPDQMRAAIVIDTGFGPPPPAVAKRKAEADAARNIPDDRPNRVYPTIEEALARFRLMPPQPTENTFIVDFIARRSLMRAPLPAGETAPDGSGQGWSWRFDPRMWAKLERNAILDTKAPGDLEVPLAHIYGDKSLIIDFLRRGHLGDFPPGVIEVEIPDCHHHVMIDQPLALVAALRALLAGCRPNGAA